MRLRKLILTIGFALIGSLVTTPSASAAPNYDRTCGVLPGDGYFGFVRAKDTTCRRAWKVTRKASRKFCNLNNDCVIDQESGISQRYRGTVWWNGWRCKVMNGWEIYRVKCRKGNRFVLARGGA
jgi:hypothetical protein